MRAKSITGIYAIENTTNKKKYIGSAATIIGRWSWHKSALKYNYHHSTKLQRAWNKYGRNKFKFWIVEECSINCLEKREEYFIAKYDSYHNGYNCHPRARSGKGRKWSKKSREKARISQLKVCADPKEIKRRSKQAKKQHRENNFGYPTITEAGKERIRKASKRNGWKHASRLRKHIAKQSSREMSRRAKCQKSRRRRRKDEEEI